MGASNEQPQDAAVAKQTQIVEIEKVDSPQEVPVLVPSPIDDAPMEGQSLLTKHTNMHSTRESLHMGFPVFVLHPIHCSCYVMISSFAKYVCINVALNIKWLAFIMSPGKRLNLCVTILEISGTQKPGEHVQPAPTHRHRTGTPLAPPGGPEGPMPEPSVVSPLDQLKLVVLRLQ